MEGKLIALVQKASFGIIQSESDAKKALVGIALLVIVVNIMVSIISAQPEPPPPHSTEHKYQREALEKKSL